MEILSRKKSENLNWKIQEKIERKKWTDGLVVMVVINYILKIMGVRSTVRLVIKFYLVNFIKSKNVKKFDLKIFIKKWSF